MKMRIVVAVAAVALAASTLVLWGEDGKKAPENDLVVHEWGTFTSMQGADGTTLEGLQHEETELPAFVYSRSKIRACPLRDKGYKGMEVDVEKVTKKMETPVTYFYTDHPQRVRVRVCFNHGLLSQWYPVTDTLGPPEGDRDAGPLDMSKVEKSFLEWEIDVLKKGEGDGEIPVVRLDDPWRFARIPDSNCVRTVERTAPRIGPIETEKFLFYRGLGQFTLPIHALSEKGGKVTVENEGDDEIRHLFVLNVKGERGEFTYVDSVPAHGEVSVTRPLGADAPSLDKMIPALRAQMEEKLVAEGLYPKEAEAMTRTWEGSYFRTEGYRVLYVLSRKMTDSIIPIAVDPAPKTMVRVMVGRLECITPEVAELDYRALDNWKSDDAGKRAAARAHLESLGRFLEPHVRSAMNSCKNETVWKNGEAILKSLSETGDK